MTMDGSGSSDIDDGIVSYEWVQTGGLSVALTGKDTAQPTFSAPMITTGQTAALSFRLSGLKTASDSRIRTR